jgi:hypothetical protein
MDHAPMSSEELIPKLEAAERSPEEIAAAVAGLSDRVLGYKPAPDKWCILEILAHLADIEIVYGYRMRQMLADKEPVIAPIDQDDWATNLRYIERPAAESLDLYRAGRLANIRLLRQVGLANLDKGAFHPERQRKVTVREIMEMLLGHGPNHLAQIERLKQQAKG